MSNAAEQRFEITVTLGTRHVQTYVVPASKVGQQHRIWGADMGTGRKRYKLSVRAL